MSHNRIRDQYKNISVLLRRFEHVTTDYDVFVVTEENIEAARMKAATNARKFLPQEINEEALASWEDWLDKNKVDCIILGYTNKAPKVHYKGYLDIERTPVAPIVKAKQEFDERQQALEEALAARRRDREQELEESEGDETCE